MYPVRIFTQRGCPYSQRAKELLDSYHVDYNEVDITNEPRLRQLMEQASGGATMTPQVFINGQHIGGADELEMLDRQGRLSPLLGEDQAPPQFI